MWKMTLKGLLARKRRLFTTALAVTLGVAFMSGTLVFTDTIGKTFDDLFGNAFKNTDAVVRQVAAFDGPQGETAAQRGRVDASLVARRLSRASRSPRARSSATPGWSARTGRPLAGPTSAHRRSAPHGRPPS
jgi:hypothetical protein